MNSVENNYHVFTRIGWFFLCASVSLRYLPLRSRMYWHSTGWWTRFETHYKLYCSNTHAQPHAHGMIRVFRFKLSCEQRRRHIASTKYRFHSPPHTKRAAKLGVGNTRYKYWSHGSSLIYSLITNRSKHIATNTAIVFIVHSSLILS